MKRLLKKNSNYYYEVRKKPSLQSLQKYYKDKYYQKGLGSYEVNYDAEEKNWIRQKYIFREKLAEAFLPFRLRSHKTMLDVGCGEAFGMYVFKKRGWKVKGLDFSSAGILQQNPNLIKKAILGDIEKNLRLLEINRKKFSCVILINVLEHVISPKSLLISLNKITETGGIIIATVPNDFSATQKLAQKSGFINKEFWVSIPEHLSYFNFISFKNIFRETGWKCQKILSDFPVDWFLFHNGSNYIKNKNAGKAAHRAQIKIESEIFRKPFENQCNLFQALANIGMGRNLTGIFKKESKIKNTNLEN